MVNLNRRSAAPIKFRRTNRVKQIRGLTSMPAGKMVPLAAFPVLREDSIRSGTVSVSLEMMETIEILLNSVNVRVMAYLVPTLALERFQGSMDILNRSYRGEPPLSGEEPIPYIETHTFKGGDGNDESREVYEYLGLHKKPDALVNTMYLESYNQIWNHRAANRSKELTPRNRLDDTLAPAFWVHEQFQHIVPDFDQAAIDGEVALNIVDANLPVKGIGLRGDGVGSNWNDTKKVGASAPELMFGVRSSSSGSPGPYDGQVIIGTREGNPGYPEVFAEMRDGGITVSLSNIELAKKTQAFAKLRQRFEGHSDEWLIDMLMSGLSIPDQNLKHPILLADRRVPFSLAKRYASDGDNLTESVVNGRAQVNLRLRLPRLVTGGVIMIVAEATPDQLFERQEDVFFSASNTFVQGALRDLPDALRDTLDPEKVEVVKNSMIDTDHDSPDDTFGYAPMNWRWNQQQPNIGGRYYRPDVNATVDGARLRIWAVETENPTLAEDFYLCTTMHTKPFVVDDEDPFEAVTVGTVVLNGLTQFGGRLIEASESWDKVLEKAPTERLQKAVDAEEE